MKIFTGERDSSKETREAYARDASAFRVFPREIFYPKTVADIATVLTLAHEEKKHIPDLTISVRAGGTCMSGGSLNTGWIIDMTKHLKNVKIDVKNKTATVETGAYFRDIEDAAAQQGLMFAPYPSSHRICGIGGMLGNNASGEKSLRYGATIDNVLELEVLLADGTILKTKPKHVGIFSDRYTKTVAGLAHTYTEKLQSAQGRVSKTASGYRLDKVTKDTSVDLTPLFIGAQGTLGIITKAVLQLVPIPQYTQLIIISIDNLAKLPTVLQTVLQHNPECVETFDRNTFLRAREYMSQDAKHIEQFFHQTTELIVMVQFSEETRGATTLRARECVRLLQKKSITVEYVADTQVSQSAWNIRRSSYTLIRDHNPMGYAAVPCVEDVIVPIDTFDIFIPKLQLILKKYNSTYGFHGHIGEGALRIIPVFDMSDDQVAQKIIDFTRDVFQLVKQLNGNMSADHSDGIIRSPFLREFYGDELYMAFTKIKRLFDPENIFNSGKKIGARESAIIRYLDR